MTVTVTVAVQEGADCAQEDDGGVHHVRQHNQPVPEHAGRWDAYVLLPRQFDPPQDQVCPLPLPTRAPSGPPLDPLWTPSGPPLDP
eukprot:346113-Prorocentrum_minimum.AAC.1